MMDGCGIGSHPAKSQRSTRQTFALGHEHCKGIDRTVEGYEGKSTSASKASW
jgi:hypothetical protein